jgi:hypothetical protein
MRPKIRPQQPENRGMLAYKQRESGECRFTRKAVEDIVRGRSEMMANFLARL